MSRSPKKAVAGRSDKSDKGKKLPPPPPPREGGEVGRVIRAQSNRADVEIDGKLMECTLRGRMRLEERKEANPMVVGDLVRVFPSREEGTGVVEEVLPRKSVLARARTGKMPQVLAANVDQALIVFAAALPDPDSYQLYQLDKLLVQAQSGQLAPLICCNKIDLRPESREVFDEYVNLGFPVVYTSAKAGIGLEELRERLHGKLNVLCGPSGVGKSSLLNALHPGLQIRTGEVSDWTRKGKHTTTRAEMHALGPETWVVDTPGIRRLELWEVPKEEVEEYFPEIEGLWEQCADPNCMHLDEGNCEVRRRVESGEISERRYESYRSIVQGR
ncbi:MAG: ribosome small subunit-dependent GTPase A [Armatimonadetes bacterium]|nr:ribosome small subunit-dependent GTPase A [Armatimonadota bacterium]